MTKSVMHQVPQILRTFPRQVKVSLTKMKTIHRQNLAAGKDQFMMTPWTLAEYAARKDPPLMAH